MFVYDNRIETRIKQNMPGLRTSNTENNENEFIEIVNCERFVQDISTMWILGSW